MKWFTARILPHYRFTKRILAQFDAENAELGVLPQLVLLVAESACFNKYAAKNCTGWLGLSSGVAHATQVLIRE